MKETIVVNVRNSEFDVYIGRKGRGYDGYFGNPFQIGRDGDRGQVIRKYRKWFWKRINDAAEFRRQVEALEGKRLGCFCKPRACHGDVIVAWLKSGKPLRPDNGETD